MHHVVMDVLRADHQVANQFGVLRHLGADGVLNCTHRRDAVNQRAHTANALRKRPRVARIPVPQDDLDAPHHGAGRVGLGDLVAFHLRFDAEVTLDASDRVDYDSCVHD